MSLPVLSEAVNRLDAVHKDRYRKKLDNVGFIHDPYLLPPGLFMSWDAVLDLPQLEYPNIYNYLVTVKSAYTHADLKAYKSLDSYKYFITGFVTPLQLYAIPQSASNHLVMAKVSFPLPDTSTESLSLQRA